jgi:hypothetical protein
MEKWFNRQLVSGLPYLEHSNPYGAAQPPPYQALSEPPRLKSRLQPAKVWSAATSAATSIRGRAAQAMTRSAHRTV